MATFTLDGTGLSRRQKIAAAATFVCKPCCAQSGPGSSLPRPVCVPCPDHLGARYLDVSLVFAGSCTGMVNTNGIVCGFPCHVLSLTNNVSSCFTDFTNTYTWSDGLSRYVPAIRCVTACQWTSTHQPGLSGTGGPFRYTLLLYFSDVSVEYTTVLGIPVCRVKPEIYFGIGYEYFSAGIWNSGLPPSESCVTGPASAGLDSWGDPVVCNGAAILGTTDHVLCINVFNPGTTPILQLLTGRNGFVTICPGDSKTYDTTTSIKIAPTGSGDWNCPTGTPESWSGDCCRPVSVTYAMRN